MERNHPEENYDFFAPLIKGKLTFPSHLFAAILKKKMAIAFYLSSLFIDLIRHHYVQNIYFLPTIVMKNYLVLLRLKMLSQLDPSLLY